MNYNINLKNVKQSVANLSLFLKDKNIEVPHSVMLEGFSKALYFKNWNTLKAVSESPQQISHIKNTYKYMIEIEIDMNEKALLSLFKESLESGKSKAHITQFSHKNNHFHIELDLSQESSNILTGFIIFSNKLKDMNVKPTRFEFCRVQIEKESFMNYFK